MIQQKSPADILRELDAKYPELSTRQFVDICYVVDITAPDPLAGVMIQLELPLDHSSCGSQQ